MFDAVEGKGQIVFVTLTVRHQRKDGLEALKRLVTEACRKARQGKPWALAVERYGIVGVMVGPEVTYSQKHGWHFHLHLAVVMRGASEVEAAEGGEWLIERYRSYIQQAGGRADRKAQDVTVVWRREDLVDYLTKGSFAWEVASAGATKQGKAGWTPWDLATLAGRGDAEAAKLFREYAAVMPGTRSCVISKSMADKLGIQPSDDSDAPGVEEQKDEVVGSMEPSRWHRVLRHGYAADVLKVVGNGWQWPAIDHMISRMLGEELTVRIGMRTTPRPAEHTPTVQYIAQEAAGEAHRFKGRKGRALQFVINREREYAKDRNLVFIGPNLRQVMALLAA